LGGRTAPDSTSTAAAAAGEEGRGREGAVGGLLDLEGGGGVFSAVLVLAFASPAGVRSVPGLGGSTPHPQLFPHWTAFSFILLLLLEHIIFFHST